MLTSLEPTIVAYLAEGSATCTLNFTISEELRCHSWLPRSHSDMDILLSNAVNDYLSTLMKGLNAYLRDNATGVQIEMEASDVTISGMEIS